MDGFAQAVGVALRRARNARGMTLQDVARISDRRFKASVLGGYERGERTISVERFAELARLYGVPPDQLMAEALREVDPLGRLDIVVDLNRLAQLDERSVHEVAEFIHRLRTQRGDYVTDVISLRSGDVEALALSTGMEPRRLLATLRPALREGRGGQAGEGERQGR